jgi:type IV pilus assembly protein PilY1
MAYPARQNIAELPKDTPPRDFYYMDGSPSAADVWLPTAATEEPADGTWNDWRTVLIGGMRQGGRVVWALDVTNPPDHDSASGEQVTGPDYPGYLWEFPCEASSCDGWRPYMGETWSQPIITRVKATVDCGNAGTWSGCGTYDRWVAIFGGGYDASGDPNKPHGDPSGTIAAGEYDPGTDADTLLAGRALFMVDIATGEVLAAKRFEYDGTAGDASDGEPGMQYAVASSPAVFDLDFDGYADAVYVGDLGGNVWKWLIHPPAEDHIRGSAGDDHQARWKFLKILAAENCTSCSPKHYKSFYHPPTGAVLGQYLWLALGSGERNDLMFGRDGGLSSAEKNRFYVFKDSDPFELERDPATLPYTDVSPSTDFVDGTTISDFNPSSCLSSGAVGFYLEGEDGEKFVTDSVIFFGVVLTGSYVPAPSTADPCTATGKAYLYGFHLLCGEGVFPPESEGQPNQRRIEIGGGSGGMPNAPRVSVGPVGDDGGGGDCTDMVVVITSEGSGFEDCLTERPDSGLSVKTWRDL